MNNAGNLDYARELIPIMWELTKKDSKCEFNIHTYDSNHCVHIHIEKRNYYFFNKDKSILTRKISKFVEEYKRFKFYKYLNVENAFCAA